MLNPTSIPSRVNSPSHNLEGIAAKYCNEHDAQLVRVLGSGAYKQVFLINQRGARLALKIALISASLKERFERESTALLECRHAAIATLHKVSSFTTSGDEYWVSIEEYLHGGTLADRLKQGKLSTLQTLHIGATLGDALFHLHLKCLVHRDIKPANILFRSENEPVLTDFGLVRVLDKPSLTHDFMAQGPGTPLYSAPEQLLNEKASIDWRTDQFGLSLVLAECVLGYHAFDSDGAGQREAVLRIANRLPLADRTKNELNTAGLGCLIKALSPWPVQRYRQPEEFIKLLSKGEQNGGLSPNGA